ncbi:hypothetical protein [Proteiniclasticum ruminis]|uniref:Uncharacterized protein n=1 Tax=Proteiniclasticum ruminis TaxID=398199 RepID=A0A1G8RPV2_9CLOT|nr:hypothetical protein [Proteiniclasticum ruminis]SDJ18933.1 hypothetical protein SAMN05421804_10942 [Proteiniclasticum ruminis]
MEEDSKKNELLKSMVSADFEPVLMNDRKDLATYHSVRFSKISSLGVGFEPIVGAFQQIMNQGKGGSGLYRVTVEKGASMAKRKDGSAFIGAAFKDGKIHSQANINPVMINPTMLFMAAALANIDKKLDDIKELQIEMLSFLVQKEKSALRGDLHFLSDVFNNYKYNWNNEKYKNANHIKVLDIRQNAGKAMDFYQEQIKSKIGKRKLLHSDKDARKDLQKIMAELKEFQLSLYLFGFAYFLEILLQENFDESYLQAVINKIEAHASNYGALYSEVYMNTENSFKTSVQSRLFSGISAVNKMAGEKLSKVPGVSKSQLDETLLDVGEKLGRYGEKRVEITMEQLSEEQFSCVEPFVENIMMINRMYNSPLAFMFDEESLYLEVVE